MVKRLQKLLNRKNSENIIVTALILITVMLVIYGVGMCMRISSLSSKEFKAIADRELDQTVKLLENTSRRTVDNCKSIFSSNEFGAYSAFQNGGYYEAVSDFENSDVDMEELYRYYKVKQEMINCISKTISNDDYVASVYFYDSKNNIILLNDGRQYSEQRFFDNICKTYLTNNEKPYVDIRQHSVNNENYVMFVYQYSDRFSIFYNLKYEMLCYEIKGLTERHDEDIFAVTSASGSRILSCGKEIEQGESGLTYATQVMDFLRDNKKYHVLSSRTDTLNLNVIWGISAKYYSGSIIKSISAAVISFLVLTVMALFVIKILLESLVKPIKKLAEGFGDNNYIESANNLDIIKHGLSSVMQKNDELMRYFNDSLPILREKIILTILFGSDNDEEDIKKKAQMCQLSFVYKWFTVVIFVIHLQNGEEDRDKIIEASYSMKKIIRQLNSNIQYVSPEDDKIAVILNTPEKDIYTVYDLVKHIKDKSEEDRKIKINAVIGNSYQGMAKIHTSYEEASDVLEYADSKDIDDIVQYNDIIDIYQAEVDYPGETEQNLINYIRFSDADNALEQIKHFISIINENKELNEKIKRRWCYKLISGILMIMGDLKISEDIVQDAEKEYYDMIREAADINDIVSWIKSLTVRIISCKIESSEEHNNQYIEKAQRLVEEKDGNISLNSVAEELFINPSYLSRLFKKYAHMTFSEYLGTVRIERAKKYLEETNLKVFEIGDMIGYNNSFYFIKKFKETTGITPAEYRRKILENKDKQN